MRYFPSVSLDEVTQVFDLSGNCFFYAAIPKDQPREGFIKLDMIKEDLIATTRVGKTHNVVQSSLKK